MLIKHSLILFVALINYSAVLHALYEVDVSYWLKFFTTLVITGIFTWFLI